MADQPADDRNMNAGQFHGGFAPPQPQQAWPAQDAAQKPAFYNPQQMPAAASGPPMFFNPASFDTAATPPFLPQQAAPSHPPQQQWDHPTTFPPQPQPNWNSHEVQNGPPHQGGFQGANLHQNEYPQQPYQAGWQEQDLYPPPITNPLADSRTSTSFYESSGHSSTFGYTFSSENPSLNSSERTSPMLGSGDYTQGGFPYEGNAMDIPRDGMPPPEEGAAMFREPEGNSVPNDSGPVGQYFSNPGNTNTASVPASLPQVSVFNPQFGLPEESRSAASLGHAEREYHGEESLTRELTGQEQEEQEQVTQQFVPPENTQPPMIPNFESSQPVAEVASWDLGGAPQEMRRELTGQEDGLDSQLQDPIQYSLQPPDRQGPQAPPTLTVDEPAAGISSPSSGHSRNSSQQFDTISLGSAREGNPSRSGSRASSLIVEGQAQPSSPAVGGNTREDFDVAVGTKQLGDHSRSGSVDSGRSAPGVVDGPPQNVAQPESVAGMDRSRSGSAESGRSGRSNRSATSMPPGPPLNVPFQEGAAMERSRSGSAESGRSGSSGRPPSLSRHGRAESIESIQSAGSNPALSSQPPLMEEQSPGDGAPSPQPTNRPSDVGPGDSPEGAASPDEPTQPQQGDGEPEPPPQNTRPPQARPSGHSPPPPSRPSIPNFPIFPMEGSMAPQFPFTGSFPAAGPSMPSPIQHSASSPFQPVAARPQPFPARTEHNGFPGEGQDSTPTSGNDNDAATSRQDREPPPVARQPSREEHHPHSRDNLLDRDPLPRREDMRNVGEDLRERRTSGERDGAEGQQSSNMPPPIPVQPHHSQSHHGHAHHGHQRRPDEPRESTPTASLWAADVPSSVPSVILAPAAPPTLTQAPSVQPHPVPMFVPAPNLPNTMQALAASPQEKPPPASAIPASAFSMTSAVSATAPTTLASTPSQPSPSSSDNTYRNASAPPPDSTSGAQQNVAPVSTQSYSTPPSRQTSTASNSSYGSQSGRSVDAQERRNPQESQPSPSRSPRQVAGNEGEPDDRYSQRGQPQKPAVQATQPTDTKRDAPPPVQSNQHPNSDHDYSRTREGRGREGDTSYSAQEPDRPPSRSSAHGGDRDWERERGERYYDRRDSRDSWYDQRDKRYDGREYYQERDYRSRSYDQDPRYARQGSYDSYYGRQESRERERPHSRQGQERERPNSRQGDRPRSRQGYDRDAYYRQYSAEYDRSAYYDQEKYRRRRDYYGREYDSRSQRDPRYNRDRGSQRSTSVDETDYSAWANDPRYQEWYNYYYGRHGNSYDPRYYEYYKQQQQQQHQGYDMYAYDPRYDNSYDDENYEDDRRSVHSNASGHSSHSQHSQGWGGQYDDRFARDFHRDSTQADTSGYNYSTSDYVDSSGYYRDSWQQGMSPAARTTPAKFHIPHVLARFGPGGHMIKVLPNNPADGMPAVVEVHALESLLVNNNEVEELRSFHGPLVKGVTHKSDVIRFCQDKAASCLASTDIRDKESAALLWQLLELLCRQNGTIVGTDIAELLLQGHPSMAYPQRTEAEGEDRGSQGDLSQASTTSDGTAGGVEAADIERLTQKFRELLLFGRKKDALEWAMKGNLWGHALLLASKMDARAHANVMTRFANSLPMNDPLQTLYQLMSHRQPAAVTSCADERWGDWRPHLAMVLSNHTQRPEVDRKSIITLGDTLGSRGLLHAAHFCYLMAQVNFGHYSKKASKMVLLGTTHSLPFMEFASNDAIQMTEVYEYAMTLGNGHYILPSFQEYKFLYATRLAECGMTAQALMYCECIVSAVERSPTSFSCTLISQLHQLSERLFWHDPQFSSLSSEEDQDYDWINSIRYMNQQVLEGALQPSSASDTPMFVGSTEPSIDGTSTPTPGETTFTGVGQQQYEHAQQQEQYEGYNTAPVDPTAYQPVQQQGGTDSPYQQYQQQQQPGPDPNSYQPWSKQVPPDMNLMASMNSEYSTTSNATTTTDGGTEVENDVPNYYDQMAGQVSFKTLAPSSPEESPRDDPSDTTGTEEDSETSPRALQRQRSTPDSLGSQGRNRALSGSSHASTTRARTMSGSSQLSHGSQRMRRRQRTTSESSQVDIKEEPAQKKQDNKVPNTRQASTKPKDVKKAPQSHQGQKTSAQSRGGGSSWLGGLFNKMLRGKNEIHLPDDTDKSIVWDASKNKWVNQDEGEEEDAAPPPPPPKDPLPSPAGPSGGPAPPPGSTPNRFSRRAGATGKYVDVLGQSGTTKPAVMAPPPDLFPGMAPSGTAMPSLFVPAAVPTSDASEPQGSQLQETLTQGDTHGTPVQTQGQQQQHQQQQQQPMFFNPNEPMAAAPQAPPTSTSTTQAQLSRSSSMSSMSFEVSQHLKPQQPQDNTAPPPADQGMVPPQGAPAPPMFFNPSSFGTQNSPFNSPGQGGSGLGGSRPRYARPR